MFIKKFLSCDWGTSSFRIREVDAVKKEICGELFSDEGIAETHQSWLASGRPEAERIYFYQEILNRLLGELPGALDKGLPVICSGMVSSSIGMIELPYQKFPFTWEPSEIIVQKLDSHEGFKHPLLIVSGFRTDEDVMRGEETMLLGCDVGDDGEKIFIFPGTHSKHVFVKNKTAIGFRTYMTGEIFSLLAEKSILRNAVREGMDEESFAEGFRSGMQGNLLHEVFRVRTRQTLQEADPVSNYQFLSGLLIGAELRDLKNKDCPVFLVSGGDLERAYRHGLSLIGIKSKIVILSADEMFVRGHCRIAELYL